MSEVTAEPAGQLAGQLNLLHARLTAHMAELLACDGWQVGGMKSPSQYLVWQAGLSPERARSVMRVAERRHLFPTLAGLFDEGQLSLEQMAELVRAPEWADAELVDFARIATVPRIRRALRSNMFTGDPDQPDVPVEPKDRVSFGVGRDGRWRLSANLDVAQGKRVEAALAERRDAIFTAGHEGVTWSEALVDVAERSLDTVDSAGRRDRFRTWIHLDVTHGTATTTDGWHIPMVLADRLMCDGVVQPVWASDGVPFSVGRAQHIVPLRTRRVVELRDRGCRVPGCDESHVEIHHIVHWLNGGRTDTWNLISLCPRHHRMHHQGRLGISGDADRVDGIVFTDVEGRVIAPRGEPVVATGPPPTPNERYRCPPAGRLDWRWLNGWEHPNATRQRVANIEAARAAHRNAHRDAA